MVADSEAVRARRRRAHLRGDHHDCGPKCTARRVEVAAAVTGAETVTEAVDAFAAAVGAWPDDDPRRVELALARAYAVRIDAGDGDRLMGEFVVGATKSLAVDPSAPADFVDEINAAGAARQLARLVRTGA